VMPRKLRRDEITRLLLMFSSPFIKCYAVDTAARLETDEGKFLRGGASR
jgi:hypothetical protein